MRRVQDFLQGFCRTDFGALHRDGTVDLGDIIIAEPKAMIGFAGPRVIAGTVRQELPEGFQRSEFLMDKGFVDRVTHRHELRSELARIIDYAGK